MNCRTVLTIVVALASGGAARVLRVGPGQPYAVPSAAFAAAADGDTVRIDPAGDYVNDVGLIARDRLMIEADGPGRTVIRTDGRVYGRKGIWVFAAGHRGLTVRNVELAGARVADADGANGAGLRIEGADVTVEHCRFDDDQDGILSGGTNGTIMIEHCQFDRCGPNGLAHNVYISGGADRLVFQFNDSRSARVGHLLKSRAAVNLIRYNRLDDGDGHASYELDLPNGGRSEVVGNLIRQSADTGNATMLAYGEEGHLPPGSSLTVAYNTFVNDRPDGGTFIDAQHLPVGFRLRADDNVFAGPGTVVQMNAGRPTLAGNVMATVTACRFVAADDFHPGARSPAVHAAVTTEAMPAFECGEESVPRSSTVDAGAFTASTGSPHAPRP